MAEKSLEQEAEAERKRRQRDFLKANKEARELHSQGVRILEQLGHKLAVMEEIAASGQSHAAALYVEWKQLWCKAVSSTDYDGGKPPADLKVLRQRVTKHGADEVRAKMRLYFSDGDDWTRRQNWSMSVFDKRYAQLGTATDTTSQAVETMLEDGWYDK